MKYGLVLAGGGARGAYQLGVWRAIEEMGLEISAISGASIGAINGAIFAQGDYKRAEELWRGISLADIVSLPEGMKSEGNLFALKNVKEIIAEAYKNNGLDMSPLEKLLKAIINEDKLRNSPVEFGMATYSMTNKSGVCKFKEEIPEGDIVQYLMASASLPGFKPRSVDAQKFLDGGVFNNMPIDMMLEKGIDNIIAVNVKGIGIYKNFNLAGKNVINVKCTEPVMGIMEFRGDGIDKSISNGYLDCLKAFSRLEGEIYAFKNEDYIEKRAVYSKELILNLEKAARVYDIPSSRIYGIDELIDMTLTAYYEYEGKIESSIKESLFDMIKQGDDNTFVAWIVKMLENGKNDFIAEKMSILGANYDAASAIMYFKRQKSYCI